MTEFLALMVCAVIAGVVVLGAAWIQRSVDAAETHYARHRQPEQDPS